MKRIFFILIFSAAIVAQAPANEALIGTWKLVSWVNVDEETKEVKKPYGEHPKGWLILLPNARMMALLTGEGRKAPQTDEDRAAALKSMVAYTGKYRIEGNTFTTKVDAAWNEAWVGTDQKRTFKLEGGKLIIITMSQPAVNMGNRMMHAELVWEREQ